MSHLVHLLERKNICFRSFQKICIDFIDEIASNNVANLEMFQKRRQGIINVLEQLEAGIRKELEADAAEPTSEERLYVAELLRQKEGMVRSILDLDLQILAHLDRLKSETIHRLQSLQSGRKTISAYRSPLEAVEAKEDLKREDREA